MRCFGRWLAMASGAALGLVASSALAASSHCAQLPTQVMANVGGTPEYAAARFTAQGFTCPTGFELQKAGGVERCARAGAAATVARNPRADCYASLELGPVRAVPAQPRPALQCPGVAKMERVIALRGRNLGWDDIALSVARGASVRVQSLTRSGGAVPVTEDPFRQDCSPHDCRLVRLTTNSGTPAEIELRLTTPGNAAATNVSIATQAMCPALKP